jgi:hypothetical protein
MPRVVFIRRARSAREIGWRVRIRLNAIWRFPAARDAEAAGIDAARHGGDSRCLPLPVKPFVHGQDETSERDRWCQRKRLGNGCTRLLKMS